jgi:hypothetical protein
MNIWEFKRSIFRNHKMTEKAKELGSEYAHPRTSYQRVDIDRWDFVTEQGLTKREYFAAMVMQGIIATGDDMTPETAAKWSVKCSDALLEELIK